MDNACDQSHHELNLLNLSLEKFMIVMQEELVFKPSTVAEKLRRIRLAISFIIRQKDDATYTKGKRIIDLVEEWGRGLGKDISIQKKERALMVRQLLHQLEDPNEFLEHDKVCLRVFYSLSLSNVCFTGEGETIQSFQGCCKWQPDEGHSKHYHGVCCSCPVIWQWPKIWGHYKSNYRRIQHS